MANNLYLAAAFTIVTATGCGPQPELKSIETGRGTIQFKESVSPDRGEFKGTVRDLTQAEQDKMQRSLSRVEAFIDSHVTDDMKDKDILEKLDRAFSGWLYSNNPDKESPEEVEVLIGAALGEYCIERLPLKWAVVTDDQGTEFALIGENPPSRSFPLASVRYRIEDRKEDFIGALFEAIKHTRDSP